MRGLTLRDRVVEAVLSLGPCTAPEVIARMGRHVPAAQAVVAALAEVRGGRRKRPPATPGLVRLGVRVLVRHNLRRACKRGRIRRLAPGVYAPPEVKLLEAPGAG